MKKFNELHISIFDGDDDIKYIKYDDFVKIMDRVKETQENLTNDLEREKSQVKEYGTRLLKAIEYIDRRDIEWCSEEHTELLNILKGEDNNGKN